MEQLTFEQLPQAVNQLFVKLERIEQLLCSQGQPAVEEPEQILNLDSACKLLNLAKPTVYGLVSQRKLPFMKRGKKLYFNREELTRWIHDGHQEVKESLSVIVDKTILAGRKKGR